jgi:hypothetical protein
MSHSDIVFTENCDPFVLKVVQAKHRQRDRFRWWKFWNLLAEWIWPVW